MNKVYLLIVFVTLFGDFVFKRLMSADYALITLYGLSAAALVSIVLVNKNKRHPKPTSKEAYMLSFFVYFLVVNYFLQALIALDVPFLQSITHAVYVSTPLLFIPIILRHSVEFDLKILIKIFLVLMIPINIVGLIQYFVNPSFLISTVYREGGGIIIRNSYIGSFLRFPSIFASADRYSAVGLVHFYFTIILLWLSTNKTPKLNGWIFINLVSSIVALVIAGERSLIFIVLALIILMTLSVLLFRISSALLRKRFNISLHAKLIVLVAGIVFFTSGLNPIKKLENVPVLNLLITSTKVGAVENRVNRYISSSALPNDFSFTGEGLGKLGNRGKPAELGIASIWIECGVVGGLLIMIGYSGIIVVLALVSFRAFINGDPLRVCVFCLPVMALTTGLITGLTSVFELSSGILLMTAIGGLLHASAPFSRSLRPMSRFSSAKDVNLAK